MKSINSPRKRILFALFILLLLGIFALAFLRSFPSLMRIENPKDPSYTLPMDEALFYRQTYNNCGPYSVMAAVNILTGEKLDGETLAAEMKWRIRKNLTFPQGVVQLLHKYKIRTKEYVLWAKSDSEKAAFLRSQILHGTPVILLVKVHGVLHYVTVLGYNENGFMLYDSMQEKSAENPRYTIRDESVASGNTWLCDSDLISLWNKGGVKFAFRNWCIVCNTEKDLKRAVKRGYNMNEIEKVIFQLANDEPLEERYCEQASRPV